MYTRQLFDQNFNNEKLLTPHIVAKRLGKSVKWVYQAIEIGKIKAVNIGLGKKRPRWFVKQSDLNSFINEQL